jgi:translocation and assembly module TamB
MARGAIRQARYKGSVRFQDVTFGAGPAAREFLAFARLDQRLALRLDEPILLDVRDGRVHQEGLALPLGDATRVEFAGWVDFDKNLEITASLPLTSAMMANQPVLNTLVGGTKIQVPIRGTLDNPKFDLDAGSLGLKEAGSRILKRSVVGGLPGLLKMFVERRPSTGPAPPTLPERPGNRRTEK